MTSKEIVTGGIRSFFIESKLIKLVLEGGSFFVLQIFKYGKNFHEICVYGQESSTVVDV